MPDPKDRSATAHQPACDQDLVVQFLLDPDTHGGTPVEHIQTHISHIFLAGDHAYKMKKAVTLPFVDFSSLDARLNACRGEIEVNSRTAPDIYLDVVAVNASAGNLTLGGDGEPVEYLVRMHRFPQDSLLDRIAAEHRLTPALVRRIADKAAELHLSADRHPAGTLSEDFEKTATDLLSRLNSADCSDVTRTRLHRLGMLIQSALNDRMPEIRARARHGAVRHGHGDLHLGNLCVFNGNVRLFDAIEFEPRFSHIDILYDIAFVAMDLLHRGCNPEAILMLGRYLSATRDYAGVDNLRLFMAVRAGVRALVALLGSAPGRETLACEYLDLAIDILDRPRTPRLIAIGGRSGTGKSTLALALAPELATAPDVIVLRADELRKRMFDVAPEDRLPASAYTAEVTGQVYRRLFRDAARTVCNGATAILDASFLNPAHCADFMALGQQSGVSTTGIWLTAATDVLANRLEQRRGDASDADPAVMLGQQEPVADLSWHAISAQQHSDAVLAEVLELLGTGGNGA